MEHYIDIDNKLIHNLIYLLMFTIQHFFVSFFTSECFVVSLKFNTTQICTHILFPFIYECIFLIIGYIVLFELFSFAAVMNDTTKYY